VKCAQNAASFALDGAEKLLFWCLVVTMQSAACVLALAGSATAFIAAPLAGAVKSSSTMSMVASKSLPFLPKPEKVSTVVLRSKSVDHKRFYALPTA
jgi:hypothetical protein